MLKLSSFLFKVSEVDQVLQL